MYYILYTKYNYEFNLTFWALFLLFFQTQDTCQLSNTYNTRIIRSGQKVQYIIILCVS